MSTIDTPIDLVLNIMTAEQAQDNIDQIPEKQLIFTTNKNVPIPSVSDAGKSLKVGSTGEYELVTDNIPVTHTGTVTSAGLYAVNVSNGTELYTIMLSIEQLNTNVSARGGYYNQQVGTCTVSYNGTTHLVTVQDADSVFSITSIVLVAKY